jgi:transmembrane sensor
MQELEQLIQRFWTNKTTPAENHRLIQLLEQYKMTRMGMAEYDFHDTKEKLHHLQPNRSASLLQSIHRDLGLNEPDKKPTTGTAAVRNMFRRIAAAAAVVIVGVTGFLLTTNRHIHVAAPMALTTPAPARRLVRRVNGMDSIMTVTLKDGSIIQLGKNSSLSYYEPFKDDRRDISMNGQALFKVVRDKVRPFTVYAGGIATRVLGTKFRVNAADPAKVTVQLLEGKVAVNAAPGTTAGISEVILTPGVEFSFDKKRQRYAVSTIKVQPRTSVRSLSTEPAPGLIFRKEALATVFKRVSDLYKVPLTFAKADLEDLYFTGTFLRSDDLNLVMSAICNVNNLVFTKEQDSIIITKQP